MYFLLLVSLDLLTPKLKVSVAFCLFVRFVNAKADLLTPKPKVFAACLLGLLTPN